MQQDITVATKSGLIAIHDSTILERARASEGNSGDMRPLIRQLRDQAQAGHYFCIDAEDEVSYRIRFLVDEDIPADWKGQYEQPGGTFKVAVPSSTLLVSDPMGPQHMSLDNALDLAPGWYSLAAYGLDVEAHEHNERLLKAHLGETAWKAHTLAGRLELMGCLSTPLLFVLLFLPLTRPFWWIIAPLCILPYSAALLFKSTPSFRRIRQACNEFNATLPHFFILLRRLKQDVPELHGGWIRGI